jgi:hypothetical protein
MLVCCAVTVNISSITPAIMMGSGNTDEDTPLLRPAIHLFGRRSKALDGTVITQDEFDEADTTQRINFVNHYIIPELPLPTSGEVVATLPADIAEGMYNISAKVFMMSDYPTLIGLTKTTINQSDVAAVHAKTEVMGKDLFVDREFGVQQTPTLLATITSDKEGVAIAVSPCCRHSILLPASSGRACRMHTLLQHAATALNAQCSYQLEEFLICLRQHS